MKAVLVRAGIDQAFGGWNAPVDPVTHEFVYVPIPEDAPCRPGLSTPFAPLYTTVERFANSRETDESAQLKMPPKLARRNMHRDPDFEYLTYGDNGERRGKALANFAREDLVVFYAGLRPCRRCEHRLIYAIIGVLRVDEVLRLSRIEEARWPENAHTRRRAPNPQDVIVRGTKAGSGRLRRCIPIGEWRRGAYRVREDLLRRWGDLSCRDGFLQRSAVPPMLKLPDRFLGWLEEQDPSLISENNPRS